MAIKIVPVNEPPKKWTKPVSARRSSSPKVYAGYAENDADDKTVKGKPGSEKRKKYYRDLMRKRREAEKQAVLTKSGLTS
jgi:hypothetical protein